MTILGMLVREYGLSYPSFLVVEDWVVLDFEIEFRISHLHEPNIIGHEVLQTSSGVPRQSRLAPQVGTIQIGHHFVDLFLHLQITLQIIKLIVPTIHSNTSIVVVTS
jgi:hypothetical protein